MRAKTNWMRAKKILMRVKKILMYLRKNTADNLSFNVELANGDLDVAVDKLGEVQKDVRDVVVVVVVVDPRPRERSGSRRSKTSEAGALKTPV